MAPLVVLILLLGVFPKPMLSIIEPATQATMQHVGVTDPEPRVSARRSLMSISALLPMEITAPTIEYGLLAPVLIVFAEPALAYWLRRWSPRSCVAQFNSW